MLNQVNKIIDERILKEERINEFRDLFLQEDDCLEILSTMKNRNGVKNKMNNHPFFLEDTQVDLNDVTNLQNDAAYDDDFSMDYDVDITDDDLTDLQRDVAYNDNYSRPYDADFAPDSYLDKDTPYNDTRNTPVSVDEFSAESTEYLFDEEGEPMNGDEKAEVQAAFDKVDVNRANTDASTEEEIPEIAEAFGFYEDEEIDAGDDAEVEESFGFYESDDETDDVEVSDEVAEAFGFYESDDEDVDTDSADLDEAFGFYESDDEDVDTDDTEVSDEVAEAFGFYESDDEDVDTDSADLDECGDCSDDDDIKSESFDFDLFL